jgi:UMF1 family MFS transporter
MKFTKAEKSWILYDVANSAFSMIISTTVPIYFALLAQDAGLDANIVSASWGTATSISVLILAVLSPMLGALADYRGMKKKMLFVSLLIGLAGIFVFTFTHSWLAFAIVFIVARLAYSAANVFYDSMLTDVTTDDRLDQLSRMFCMGLHRSCIPFILDVFIAFSR